jgi:hypothetical protein
MAVFWVVNFYQTTRRYNPEDSHQLFVGFATVPDLRRFYIDVAFIIVIV